jgi:hypothetical protein
MAFVDAALRHRLTDEPEALVRSLAAVTVRIALPRHACVTGTIQRVRQETRAEERKKDRRLPYYRTSIALREVVSYSGVLRLAFHLASCSSDLNDLLPRTAPAINYFGKRGSFMQYWGCEFQRDLDRSFAEPVNRTAPCSGQNGQLAALDDFGPGATFDVLNSFTPAEMKRDIHRKFVETAIPYHVSNFGFGFVQYALED